MLGRENWDAFKWAYAFFKNYYPRWGIPHKIIANRGKLFLAEFWTTLFKILRTDLLVKTTYHPRADGHSERTNQIVEIALCHLLVNKSNSDWSVFLGDVELAIVNSSHSATDASPMIFPTGLDAPRPLTLVSTTDGAASRWSDTRNEIRDTARDALILPSG